ncbi:hypothetical protein [Corynebacterium sp. sy039]|uniref:hypothetical protein n=1 Tax=Corynebacterium sp. sy039 TaxID=2599641 RepID=UPI0011B7FC44|nr:hypothetical protein [Corynebacterium sp. sy039]QDZ42689.1 hypothetical protein FQV43_05605 [Corynebacterium sp. sy039]
MIQKTILSTHDLVLSNGVAKPDISIVEGLTLIHSRRESSATVFAMTISGRMKQKSGSIMFRHSDRLWSARETDTQVSGDMWEQQLSGNHIASVSSDDGAEETIEITASRKLHKRIALAGVVEIDRLERLIPVRSVIREQAAWRSSWYKPVPRKISQIDSFAQAADVIGLEIDDERARKTNIGQLDPTERFKLRVVLALMSTPRASLVLIDDIDQVRSQEIRDELLVSLRNLSAYLPVAVISSNSDRLGICDHSIRIEDDQAIVVSSTQSRQKSGVTKQ